MIWKKWILSLIGFLSMLFCNEKNDTFSSQKSQTLVSDDLAHVLWHVMKSYDHEYDFQELVSMLTQLNEGKIKNKPIAECYTSLLGVLEKKASENAILNLQSANSFLKQLEFNHEINEVIKHKLYYKIITPGKGKPINDFSRPPLISFKEKTLSGEILSECSSPIRIPLSETISGLQKGLFGIKVGEKREIFIHPDLAYRDFQKPEPFSLIIIEVSLIAL